MPITVKKIQAAAERIDSAITNTRFEKSITLSTITGAELYLRVETRDATQSQDILKKLCEAGYSAELIQE